MLSNRLTNFCVFLFKDNSQAAFARAFVLFGILGILTLVGKNYHDNIVHEITIAYVGNSFQFVNDLPRFMVSMSDGKIIQQDSIFHGSSNLISLTKRGNGMIQHWNTSNAIIHSYQQEQQQQNQQQISNNDVNNNYRNYDSENDENDDDESVTTILHDYGACTVRQLLLGYDYLLDENSERYQDNAYINDGLNPCFPPLTNDDEDDDGNDDDDASTSAAAASRYLQYTQNKIRPKWDYVILNDQSVHPINVYNRNKTIQVLQQTYLPLFQEIETIPIFLMTYAYWRDDINMTKFDVWDIPTFTFQLYEGYMSYVQAIADELPVQQRPRMAPVGIAMATIWEENYSYWKMKLFADDQFHPSPITTFLMGTILYITIYERMPPLPSSLSSSSSSSPSSIDALWEHARRMELQGHTKQSLPTDDDITYIRWIAKRITLEGYIPKCLDRQINNGTTTTGFVMPTK